MGYFPVRYDSRVVNYNHRGFIRLATGVAVMMVYVAVSVPMPAPASCPISLVLFLH